MDMIFISRKQKFIHSIKLPSSLIIIVSVIILCIIVSGTVLFSYNIREFAAKTDIRQSEQEHKMLLEKLDSLHTLLNLADSHFGNHIAQDNRQRTFWQMAYIHPDVWSMGIGGTKYEAPEELLSNRTNYLLDEIYESIDVLKGKCYLKQTSLDEIKNKIEKNVDLWSHIPSINPVSGRAIGSGFGYRIDPIDKRTIRMHWGVDIGAPRGTRIHATADGVVCYAGWQSGYGWMVDIDHGFGFRTRYAHCQKILVEKGNMVKRGQIIALIGDTGRTTCPHLHYEVHVSGVKVNPKSYIDFSNVIFD